MSATAYVPPEVIGTRCCFNCPHARMVRFTNDWYCAAYRKRSENRYGRVATKTGRLSGSLMNIRGCRAWESMDSDDDPKWEEWPDESL